MIKHNDYRFIDKDENGKECHRHQIWSEFKEEYEDLTGATSFVDVLGKTLTWWASGLAVKTFSGIEDCKVLTKIGNKKATIEEVKGVNTTVGVWLETHKNPTVEEWIKLSQEAYKAHSVKLDKSAEEGTDLHEELEKYVKLCLLSAKGKPISSAPNEKVADFSNWAINNVKRFLWSEAHCYDEIIFGGGITDCGAEMKDGSFAIIDFKSAKEAYFNHFVQIALYDLMIKKHGLVDRFGNYLNGLGIQELPEFTKYVVVPFGAKEFTVVENNNIFNLKKAALACVEIYRAKAVFEK